jgi:hypothetical protein
MLILPIKLKYNKREQTLDVEYADGSMVRYFEIRPELGFLNSNREEHDFLEYLKNYPVRSEILKAATKQLEEPQTRPAWVRNHRSWR